MTAGHRALSAGSEARFRRDHEGWGLSPREPTLQAFRKLARVPVLIGFFIRLVDDSLETS